MDAISQSKVAEQHRPTGVLLAGATGLVGGQVLDGLLNADPTAFQIIAPTRRELVRDSANVINPIIQNVPKSLKALEQDLLRLVGKNGCDVFVCALGTTLKKAGGQLAFISVDRDMVLKLAAIARKLGAKRAIVVSSVGANAKSKNFYLRIKGEVERGLAELGFPRVDLIRPGVLLGNRTEARPGETVAAGLSRYYNPLLFGPLKKYRAIDSSVVARAIVALATESQPGWFVHEYARLSDLADA